MTIIIIILAAIAIFGLIAGIGHYKTYGRWSNKKYIEKHPEAYERQKQEWAKTSRAIDAQTQRIIEQKKAAQEYAKNHKPKCPTCGSEYVTRITALERGVSTEFMGLASGKLGKTMKCTYCGYMW